MEKIIHLLILILLFIVGLFCINNPFSIARLIALWFRFVSGSSFGKYKKGNTQIEEVFVLIEHQNRYVERFSNQIQIIRLSGFTAIFVAAIGACIILLGGS